MLRVNGYSFEEIYLPDLASGSSGEDGSSFSHPSGEYVVCTLREGHVVAHSAGDSDQCLAIWTNEFLDQLTDPDPDGILVPPRYNLVVNGISTGAAVAPEDASPFRAQAEEGCGMGLKYPAGEMLCTLHTSDLHVALHVAMAGAYIVAIQEMK